MVDIIITVSRSDTEDWLNPESDETEEDVEQWCEQYRKAMQEAMAARYKGSAVTVEWGSESGMDHVDLSGDISWEDEWDLRDEIELDMEAVADKLGDFAWMETQETTGPGGK